MKQVKEQVARKILTPKNVGLHDQFHVCTYSMGLAHGPCVQLFLFAPFYPLVQTNKLSYNPWPDENEQKIQWP